MAAAAVKNGEYVNRLIELALKGLETMFDKQAGLFCHRRTPVAGDRFANEGLSKRYTLITLLGLHRLQKSGRTVPFDIPALLRPFLDADLTLDNPGDIGLFIWLVASAMPGRLHDVLAHCEPDSILDRFIDGRNRNTMQLSWLLTGLSYATLATPDSREKTAETARTTYTLLKKNYGKTGIFGHAASRYPLQHLRNRMGSFADQVYPAYAFSAYSRAFDTGEALDIAHACCTKICDLQGSLGQWWWHYDAVSGRVAGRYPVFTVHQEGMAPMALFEVGRRTGTDFTEPIYRGLQWNAGNNELCRDMVDWQRNIIWRSIYRGGLSGRMEEVLGLAGIGPGRRAPHGLKLRREGRPYCLGWLLYAFANAGRFPDGDVA
jgi:hypothetical protein